MYLYVCIFALLLNELSVFCFASLYVRYALYALELVPSNSLCLPILDIVRSFSIYCHNSLFFL